MLIDTPITTKQQDDLDPLLKTAIQAAEMGGEVCRSYFNREFALDHKAACNLVTAADIESEQVIIDALLKAFPDHAILAEETRQDSLQSPDLWIVDPLDGTNNFAHGIPHFSVSIAYWRQGRPECGVIYNPITGELYHAKRGQGAFLGERQLHVSQAAQLNEALVGCGFYYDRGKMMQATLQAIEACFFENVHGIRRFGTASLDLIQVASGRYGGFFEYQLAPWDFAAGRLFVEEAGGRITTCAGNELKLDQSTVLATNGQLHSQLAGIVQKFHP